MVVLVQGTQANGGTFVGFLLGHISTRGTAGDAAATLDSSNGQEGHDMFCRLCRVRESILSQSKLLREMLLDSTFFALTLRTCELGTRQRQKVLMLVQIFKRGFSPCCLDCHEVFPTCAS